MYTKEVVMETKPAIGKIYGPTPEKMEQMIYQSSLKVDPIECNLKVKAIISLVKESNSNITLDDWKSLFNVLVSLWEASAIEYTVNGKASARLKEMISILDYVTDTIPDICENISVVSGTQFVNGLDTVVKTFNKDAICQINRIEYEGDKKYTLA